MLRKIQLRRIPLALVRAVLYIPQGFLEIMIKVSMQIMQWLITFLANLEWMTDYNKALAEAKKLNTTVVAAFVSVHCGPCKFLKHEVFKTVRFGWWVLNNNLVLLEVESTPANDSLMKKYGVTGVPDVLGLNADGTEHVRNTSYTILLHQAIVCWSTLNFQQY